MVFNKKITLFNKTLPNGTAKPVAKDIRTGIWCKFDVVGSTVAINAQSAGVKLTNQVEMWAKSYKDEAYATINSVDYRVERAVKTGNELTIKLLLSRG